MSGRAKCRVIVTGYPGWLASRLVEGLVDPESVDVGDPRLAEEVLGGGKVRCLVHPAAADEAARRRSDDAVEIVVGDIRDAEALARLFRDVDDPVVFHIAGVIHPRRAREFEEVNHLGTRRLIEACKGARALVYMSSNSPIGCGREGEVFDEDSSYNPYMGYGRSKMRAEMAVREAAEGGLRATIVRSPWFYGPRQPPRQTLFFKGVCAGAFPLVGDGSNLRSMAYVDNICQGLLRAVVRAPGQGEAYWIADARPYEMREIVETVREVMREQFGFRCKGRLIRLPRAVAAAARMVDAGLQGLGLYHEKIHVLGELDRTIACSIDRARNELGYEPRVELREGMRRSIAWCIDAGLLKP